MARIAVTMRGHLHRDKLEDKLREMPWVYEGKKALPGANRTMWDYYQNYWLPFGEVLTDMEREGIKVPPNLAPHSWFSPEYINLSRVVSLVVS